MEFNINNFVRMEPTYFRNKPSKFIKVNQRQEIVEEYLGGKTLVEIGVIHGISRQRVYQLLKVMGVALRGEKRGRNEFIHSS